MADATEKKETDERPGAEDVKEEKTEDVKVDADVLEEDDEFEEFEEADWGEVKPALEDAVQWEDNWDDEEDDADFSKRLREELAKESAAS